MVLPQKRIYILAILLIGRRSASLSKTQIRHQSFRSSVFSSRNCDMSLRRQQRASYAGSRPSCILSIRT
jgi:hypothetical protein